MSEGSVEAPLMNEEDTGVKAMAVILHVLFNTFHLNVMLLWFTILH